MIDLSSLEKAIAQLKKSLDYAYSDLAQNDPDIAQQFRAAGIQAFEYTYELAHKMLKRYLEATEPSAEVIDNMTFQELIRTGAERGLLRHSWDIWKHHRDQRNLSSHTYDEGKAESVFQHIPEFLQDVLFLYNELHRRQSL